MSKGLNMSLPDTKLPTDTVTKMVNISYVKHTTINDPLPPEEYITLAPRKPMTTDTTESN